MKNIVTVIGHPLEGSLNHALAERYIDAARAQGAAVEVIDLAVEEFELSPRRSRDELRARTPDQLDAKGDAIRRMVEKVRAADHIVVVHPSWWGTYPAVLKGFIDRVFMSGVAFEYGDGPTNWKRLFAGKTARILTTMDSPVWFNRWWYRDPSANSLKYPVFWYVGVKTVGVSKFAGVRFSTEAERARWQEKAAKLGEKDAGRR